MAPESCCATRAEVRRPGGRTALPRNRRARPPARARARTDVRMDAPSCGAVVAAAIAVVIIELIILKVRTPRLPPASGPLTGAAVGASPGEQMRAPACCPRVLRLLVFGDSVAAGCGCRTHQDALTGSIVRELAARGVAVEWSVVGKIGLTAEGMSRELVPELEGRAGWDACVVSVGVNNLLEGHSSIRYAAQLKTLLKGLRKRLGAECALLVMDMPAMGYFPAVAWLWPLRALIGRYAASIGETSATVCEATGLAKCVYWDMRAVAQNPRAAAAELMAADGFHPARGGCDLAAGWIVDAALSRWDLPTRQGRQASPHPWQKRSSREQGVNCLGERRPRPSGARRSPRRSPRRGGM